MNIVRNLSFAIGVTHFCAFEPLLIILDSWHIYDNGANMEVIVIGVPVMITVAQWFISFVELALKNRRISEAILQIQNVIDQREYISHIYYRGQLLQEKIEFSSCNS